MRTPAAVRDRILDAAVALLRSDGAEALSQPRVARAAGVSQGHLTYYFPRKQDLVVAVARRGVESIARELSDFFRGDGWPGAAAPERERAAAFVAALVADRERTRLLLSLALRARRDRGLRDLLLRHVAEVRSLLAAGMGRRADDPDVDLTLATLWGLAIRHLLAEDTGADPETADLVHRLFTIDSAKE